MNERPMTHEQAIELAAGYVLGALEPAEEAAVRAHLRSCPESHEEFAELGGVVPYLADWPDLEIVEPPASLRDRIMTAAAADLAERTSSTTEPTAFPGPAQRAERAGAAGRRRSGALDWALRIAAVLAIVAVGAWNLQLQGQLTNLRGEVTDLRQQATAAADYQRAVSAVLDVAAEPGSQTAVLAAQAAGGPRGIAAVGADGSIQLALQDLAPTTGDQVYETWAIVPDRDPIPLGSFKVGPTTTASFQSKPGPAVPGVVVALSREPRAGATAPTEVVSVGAASGPSN
jgi:anti-sigma factor RsiW